MMWRAGILSRLFNDTRHYWRGCINYQETLPGMIQLLR